MDFGNTAKRHEAITRPDGVFFAFNKLNKTYARLNDLKNGTPQLDLSCDVLVLVMRKTIGLKTNHSCEVDSARIHSHEMDLGAARTFRMLRAARGHLPGAWMHLAGLCCGVHFCDQSLFCRALCRASYVHTWTVQNGSERFRNGSERFRISFWTVLNGSERFLHFFAACMQQNSFLSRSLFGPTLGPHRWENHGETGQQFPNGWTWWERCLKNIFLRFTVFIESIGHGSTHTRTFCNSMALTSQF